ncbi:hypothetical protein P43SY_002205 [Pythium insidiosum]|uniref:Peptidyl-tRNA hydrolase n=1 Tax=Pythium insidiosum TaxID=114742 RepID=A0AAD5MAT6_PYTIN|nr:hypothetical protein P43SY_002205 [Pythium insidiosum]
MLARPSKRLRLAVTARVAGAQRGLSADHTLPTTTAAEDSASKEASPRAETPVKYENVRKLIVGLGNPGDKYARTRHNIGSDAVAHFLDTYVHQTLGKKLQLQHEENNHGDVARFLLPFQQDVDDPKYTLRRDDLINRSSERRKAKTLEEGVPHENVNVALLLPTTYMNRSGVAVKTFMNNHRWRLKKNAMALNRQDELLVVTDDVSLPFGTCRFKGKGGPGGQNGVKDIIKCVGTERFARLKIGVGAPQWFIGGNTGAPAGTAMDKFVLARFNADEQDDMPMLMAYVNELLRLFLHRGLSQASTVANSMDLAAFKKNFKPTRAMSPSKKPLPPLPVVVTGADFPRLCWYVDIAAYLIIRKFPVGAVTYLTYPENRSFSKTFFASHHLWFLPLCLWITKDHGGMHVLSFAGSCALTAFLASYSRLVTPFQVKVRGDEHIIYMNINGAFEFWKDIHIPVLHVLDHRSPLLYLPYLAIVGNLVANGVPHLVLLGISSLLVSIT